MAFSVKINEKDGAAIDYLDAAKLQPNLGNAVEAVLRLLKETERKNEFEALHSQYPTVTVESLKPHEGQLVVILEVGLAPEKQGGFEERGAQLIAIPEYPPFSVRPPKVTVDLLATI